MYVREMIKQVRRWAVPTLQDFACGETQAARVIRKQHLGLSPRWHSS
jgi:hypothetical protein